MSAKIIDDGPIRGTTFIFFSCANLTNKFPGSATQGHPLSDKIATSSFLKRGSQKILSAQKKGRVYQSLVYSNFEFFFSTLR